MIRYAHTNIVAKDAGNRMRLGGALGPMVVPRERPCLRQSGETGRLKAEG